MYANSCENACQLKHYNSRQLEHYYCAINNARQLYELLKIDI